MESEHYTQHVRIVKDHKEKPLGQENWRRHCGCIRTSEKLKELLKTFPAPPPPSPECIAPQNPTNTSFQPSATCISAYCTHAHQPIELKGPFQSNPPKKSVHVEEKMEEIVASPKKQSLTIRSWFVVTELVQLVQLSVTATALALYYLIYCYMQLIYYTLRSALYFHQADGPMKITIGVVTVTSLVIGFNLLLRMERLIGFLR